MPADIAVDEAGRGCLACEVVAAAVVLPPESPEEERELLKDIRDSKRMSAKARTRSATFLRSFLEERRHLGASYGIGTASAEEIDRVDIRNATFLAMHRAVDDCMLRLGGPRARGNDFRIVVDGDGFRPHPNGFPHVCVVKADATRTDAAAASILAKVHRDALVDEYCDASPELDALYDFRANKAYGTKKHMEALKVQGPTALHRRTFAPVRNFPKDETKSD